MQATAQCAEIDPSVNHIANCEGANKTRGRQQQEIIKQSADTAINARNHNVSLSLKSMFVYFVKMSNLELSYVNSSSLVRKATES